MTIQLFSVMIVVIFCNFLHCLVGGISVSLCQYLFSLKQNRRGKTNILIKLWRQVKPGIDQLLLSVSQHAWETLKAWAGRPSLFCKLEFANSFVFLTEHIFAQRNWIFLFTWLTTMIISTVWTEVERRIRIVTKEIMNTPVKFVMLSMMDGST